MFSAVTTDPAHVNFQFQHLPDGMFKDPELTLPHLYKWNAEHNPNYPLFVFQDGEQRRYITHAFVDKAIDRAARYAFATAGPSIQTPAAGPRRVVAVLANTGEFYCFIYQDPL